VRLARDGFHLVIHFHRNSAGAEETGRLVSEAGGSFECLSFDLRDPKAIDMALEEHFPKGRELFALVNNAGRHNDALAGMMSDEAFREVMEANVQGAFVLLRWATRRMIRSRAGAIVNVASIAGQTGNPGQINYAASKAALIAMTKTLAMELAPRGIRVNAVAPGLIDTEMIREIPSDHLAKLVERIPLRRLGTSAEVAGAIAFLLSDEASYITGQTLSINGGLFPA
jgi:3-oxoacyl-[acyl-carrier protein] reductase